jgi:hypothetical protein
MNTTLKLATGVDLTVGENGDRVSLAMHTGIVGAQTYLTGDEVAALVGALRPGRVTAADVYALGLTIGRVLHGAGVPMQYQRAIVGAVQALERKAMAAEMPEGGWGPCKGGNHRDCAVATCPCPETTVAHAREHQAEGGA